MDADDVEVGNRRAQEGVPAQRLTLVEPVQELGQKPANLFAGGRRPVVADSDRVASVLAGHVSRVGKAVGREPVDLPHQRFVERPPRIRPSSALNRFQRRLRVAGFTLVARTIRRGAPAGPEQR